jgi:tRNA-splicing endonuclease subunit Sen54
MSFDDEENPNAASHLGRANEDAPTAEEALEDGVPDFKLFKSMFDKNSISSKSIRKGEKDFESHGTRAQDSVLEASRQAMEDVLDYTRMHRYDGWVRGWYAPDRWADESEDDTFLRDRVVCMEHEKGNWMKDIGRVPSAGKGTAAGGRLWLLPEEALYLIERGTIDVWWPNKALEELLPKGVPSNAEDYDAGVPLSLEAAYALLIGYEGERGKVSLPKYQVYTHLKRGGFYILRAPPNPPRPEPPPQPQPSLWAWLLSVAGLDEPPKVNPHGPLVSPGLYRAYGPIYQRLALIPRHNPRQMLAETTREVEEPFRIFFHVWKSGGAPFSKKSPGAPSFRIAVADTHDSLVPDLEQVTALLATTPYDPPSEAWKGGGGRMYQRLKHGHRNVLVAVVDRGLVNFIRFGEGAFAEERLFERFDFRGGGRGGRKSGGGGGRRGGGRGRGRGGRGGSGTRGGRGG